MQVSFNTTMPTAVNNYQAQNQVQMTPSTSTRLSAPAMGYAADSFSIQSQQALPSALSGLSQPYRVSLVNHANAWLQTMPGKKQSHLAIQFPLGPSYNAVKLLMGDLLLNGSPQTKQQIQQYNQYGLDFEMIPLDEHLQLNVYGPKGTETVMAQAALSLLSQPNIDEKYFANLKNSLLNNIEKLKNLPEVSLSETIGETLYGTSHPYAKTLQTAHSEITTQSPYSTLELYRGIISDPTSVRFSWVSPQPLPVQEQALNSAIQQFQWYKNPYLATSQKQTPAIAPSFQNRLVYKLVPNDQVNRAHISYSWHSPKPQDQDFWSFKVLEKMLAGMSSDFFQVLRNQQGLVYSTTRQYLIHREGSDFSVNAQVNLDKVNDALKGFDKVIRSLITNPVSQQSLMRAKKLLQLEQRDNSQSVQGINYENSQRLEYDLAPQHPTERISTIERISAQDVQAIAKKVFSQQPIIGICAPSKILTDLQHQLEGQGS